MPRGRASSSPEVREMILRGPEDFGIRLDEKRNAQCARREGLISKDDSRIQIWVVPTNEEIVVARECARLLGVAPSPDTKDSTHL